MLSQTKPLLGRILLTFTLTLTITALFCPAQDSSSRKAQKVPATAREAAKLPDYASRLEAPAASSALPRPRPAGACSRVASRDLDLSQLYDVLYSNGPINGTTDAWAINFGFVVSNSFTVSARRGDLSGMSFGAWLFPGDTLQAVEVSITSEEFGGTTYFDDMVTFTQSACVGNQYGYNVCTATGTFPVVSLQPGTYWVNLQNALVNTGDPVYWDENSGPSMASQNQTGTIPSEAFDMLGTLGGDACIPQHRDGFDVIYSFNGQQDGSRPSGVAIDRGGNLYGAAQGGSLGSVFKLIQGGTGWVLDNLFDFLGGDYGITPEGVTVGPQGILYGTATGGVQNCPAGAEGRCGLAFDLRPSANVCVSASCPWTERALYRFNGVTDAWDGRSLTFDQAGNAYGVSEHGGALQEGAVFKLARNGVNWDESVIYSFTGWVDGGRPASIVAGNDGRLYGMTKSGGGRKGGVVFQLSPSGQGWQESVLYDLPDEPYGTFPGTILQDSEGNLFGVYADWDYGIWDYRGIVFLLKPSNGSWTYQQLFRGSHGSSDYIGSIVLDQAENIYGTAGGVSGCVNPYHHGYIFKIWHDDWHTSEEIFFDYTNFSTSGKLATDAHGNVYGTTVNCGEHGYGTVWQYTPR